MGAQRRYSHVTSPGIAMLKHMGSVAESRRRFSKDSVANLGVWLDASTLGGANGSNVSAWSDLSGNGRNVSQATTTAQPILRKTAGNMTLPAGKPVVEFDGVDDGL